MNRKRSILNPIHGWLPKEPTLITCCTSADNRFPVFARWMAITVVAWAIGNALLSVAGDLLGLTEGIGVYAWPISTVIINWGSIGLFAVYMRRKLGLQARN